LPRESRALRYIDPQPFMRPFKGPSVTMQKQPWPIIMTAEEAREIGIRFLIAAEMADEMPEVEPAVKNFGTCERCGGPLAPANRVPFCKSNPACVRANKQAWIERNQATYQDALEASREKHREFMEMITRREADQAVTE